MRVVMALICCIFSAATALGATPATSPARAKIALIIGNSFYANGHDFVGDDKTPEDRLPDLKNPCNDSKLIAAQLIGNNKWPKQNVVQRCNVTKAEMVQLLDDFTLQYMSSYKPFGFIYFAGHGVQVDDNAYIFGVDTTVDMQKLIKMYHDFANGSIFKGGLRLRQELLSTIGEAGQGSILLVIDACRENPLEATLRKEHVASVSAPKRGEPVPGIKSFYSTANGRLVTDGAEPNSPFATAFAGELALQSRAEDLIQAVVDDVYASTKDGGSPQVPDESGSFHKPPPNICFSDCGD